MMQFIFNKLSNALTHFGRVQEEPTDNQPWDIPKRQKFYITPDELKTVSIALTYYKKLLKSKKAFDKVEKVGELDNRIFNFIVFMETQESQQQALAEVN
jgi:hypothetical protein